MEYFDYKEGSYYQGVVESIERYGHSVELEVYDCESGETRTFDMNHPGKRKLNHPGAGRPFSPHTQSPLSALWQAL